MGLLAKYLEECFANDENIAYKEMFYIFIFSL